MECKETKEKTIEELLNLSVDELFAELGRLVHEKGIDACFDTSQIKDEASWQRYYKLRSDLEGVFNNNWS